MQRPAQPFKAVPAAVPSVWLGEVPRLGLIQCPIANSLSLHDPSLGRGRLLLRVTRNRPSHLGRATRVLDPIGLWQAANPCRHWEPKNHQYSEWDKYLGGPHTDAY